MTEGLENNQQLDSLSATLAFAKANADADVRRLALRKVEGVDMAFALDQIAGRQMARRKLPTWAGLDGIIYPPHLSMEQCSGEKAALYKGVVAKRLLPDGGSVVDITGGFGVDFSFLSESFAEAVYVERQANLCRIVRHNLGVLGLDRAQVVNGDGVEYLRNMAHASLLFADPARRDANGGRAFAISDCTPDVLSLKELLLYKADYVMLKLSPMLDWRKTVADMGGGVGEVHIVSVGGECKDLLLVMSKRYGGLERVYCVDDGSVFDYSPEGMGILNYGDPMIGQYLYEPNASVMKAGCFAQVGSRFGVVKIERNSHLFFADKKIDGFPGRRFAIVGTTSLNKRELKLALKGLDKANITVRNFPSSVAQLRKRLKIGEGGSVYIFATTLAANRHILLLCRKE